MANQLISATLGNFLKAAESNGKYVVFPFTRGGKSNHGTGAAHLEVPGEGAVKFFHRTPQGAGKRGFIEEVLASEADSEAWGIPLPSEGYRPAGPGNFAGEFDSPAPIPEDTPRTYLRAYRLTEAGKRALDLHLGRVTPTEAEQGPGRGRRSEASKAASEASKAPKASKARKASRKASKAQEAPKADS